MSISDTESQSINIESFKFYLAEGFSSIKNWNDSSLEEIRSTYNIILNTGQNVEIYILISNITLSAEKYYQVLIYIEDKESFPNSYLLNNVKIVIIESPTLKVEPIVITNLIITSSSLIALTSFNISKMFSRV